MLLLLLLLLLRGGMLRGCEPRGEPAQHVPVLCMFLDWFEAGVSKLLAGVLSNAHVRLAVCNFCTLRL